ncbi:olfactory protein-like [Engystomops pustulosus]|uniref:olfactory protein-like n=1 Tax=Engystomops pustulosus TaxID=76066 RepID=UPI003AFA3694
MIQYTAAILLLLSIQCQAQEVKPQENLDMHKFSGKWYGIVAASNCPMFLQMKKGMTLPTVIYSVDGNVVKNKAAFKTPDGCKQMEAVFTTIANGHYTHKSVHGDNEVIIIGTDYLLFAMEYTKTVHEGQTCITLKLLARDTALPDEIQHKFKDFMHGMGLKDDDMAIFPKGDICVPK